MPQVPFIPPILRGCEFAGILEGDKVQTMLFKSPDPNVVGGYVQVQVRFIGGPPTFDYSVWDPSTNTLTHYTGRTGDPKKDDAEITSAP